VWEVGKLRVWWTADAVSYVMRVGIDTSYSDVDGVRGSIGLEGQIIMRCYEYDYSMVMRASKLRERLFK
jgi:hypothetical protein